MSILCSPGLPVEYFSWNRIEEGLDAVLLVLPSLTPVDPAEESHHPVQNHDQYPADAEYAHGFPEYLVGALARVLLLPIAVIVNYRRIAVFAPAGKYAP